MKCPKCDKEKHVVEQKYVEDVVKHFGSLTVFSNVYYWCSDCNYMFRDPNSKSIEAMLHTR